MPTGIYIHRSPSLETRRKLSESNKKNSVGRIPPSRKGTILSEWHKKRISEANKGKVISEKQRLQISKVHKGKIGLRGEKAPNWQGGITPINEKIRKSVQYQEWRKLVFLRDNHTCVLCENRGGVIHADHIKPFSLFPDLRFEISNGRTLCKKCHLTTPTYGRRDKKLYADLEPESRVKAEASKKDFVGG